MRPYTNDNIQQLSHDQPSHFEQLADGGFWGYTQSGQQFLHTAIANDAGIRLHKFTIDQAFFYITDRGVIFADSDLQAISIYLSFV